MITFDEPCGFRNEQSGLRETHGHGGRPPSLGEQETVRTQKRSVLMMGPTQTESTGPSIEVECPNDQDVSEIGKHEPQTQGGTAPGVIHQPRGLYLAQLRKDQTVQEMLGILTTEVGK